MSDKTQYLGKSGGNIAFDDTGGSGPLVIAAPGMGDTRGVYRYLSPLLIQAGLRFVSFDLRGLGESSVGWDDYSDAAIASDYLSLLDHLGKSSAVLIGNSKTASSVVIAATDNPGKVSGLVLLGPFAREVPVKWWQKLAFSLMLKGPWGCAVWVSYYKKNLYPGNKPLDHKDYVAALSQNLAEPGRFKAFKEQASDSHAESGRRLEKVGQPSLIVMGTADPDFPDAKKEANELARIMKSKVLFMEGSGHYPQADNPDKVAPAIIDFVERVETKKD
jgi:pimeloyl-ACP methyl ester carboxylesterase